MSDWNPTGTHSSSATSAASAPPFDSSDTLDDAHEPASPVREGLPASFRMRADAHYVEQLDARAPALTVQLVAVHAIDCGDSRPVEPSPALIESIKRHGVLEPLVLQRSGGAYHTLAGAKRLAAARAAGLREVPCLVHHVGDEHARALREALTRTPPAPAASMPPTAFEISLAESLTTLQSCAALIKSATPFTRAVSIDLLQAEAHRSLALLHASQVLRQATVRARSRVPVATMLDRIVAAVEPERRLRRLALETAIDVAPGVELRADPNLLEGTLTLVILTTMSLLEGIEDATLVVAARADSVSHVAITISQDCVPVSDGMDGYVDAMLTQVSGPRPVVPLGTLAIAALRRLAQLHDGRVQIARLGAGAQIACDIPTARL